ncbi:MAG: glycosyltransferase family 1 protein [Calditrichaeota bacterium]|nr:MAG: glycosyltransferase family 1 protein [Calditrichota bacterium]
MNTKTKMTSGKKHVFFISKYGAWQDYRNEVLSFLGRKFSVDIEILTTGSLKPYLHENEVVKYKLFRSWIPLSAEKWGFFPSAVRYIFKKRPYAVLCQNDTRQFTEYLAFVACKLLGIRFVWWTHAHMPSVVYNSNFKKWVRQQYALFFLKKGDAVITYCSVGKKFLLENGLDSKHVFCAPNTLDTEKLSTLAAKYRGQKNEILNRLKIPADKKILLYMGRLTQRKNVETAISLVSELNRKSADSCHLIVIGDGENRLSLEELASEIAPGAVTFTGAVFDDELKAHYFTIADLFVIPGAVGLAIIHAFCFGLPVLTTNVKHHGPEIIYLEDGKNGFITNEGDTEALVAKTAELIGDEEKLQQMAKHAQKTVIDKANIQLMTAKMAEALAL